MADTNLLDQGLASPVTKTTPTASGNLLDQGLAGDGGVSASIPTSVPNISSASSNLLDAGLGIPNNGQPNLPVPPPQHLYQDENQPWYKRAGDWLNTPITESIFGLPETRPGAGGFERGVEHIASGLTSPLSIALTLGTFGTGGLLDSAGMTALRESGEFGAEELPQIAKAAKAAVDAYKAAPEGATAISDAVKASGVDPALWNRAQTFLYNNGLTEHDLLGGDLIDRGAFKVLRNTVPDLPVAVAARAAKTAKTLMNAGFTFQQLESASAMSPRFLDALKEGDYDKAMEYGTEVFASGALGILGTSHALHSAGELFKPLIENDAFRPNDEWLAIDRANKEREAQHAVAEQEAINLDRQTREILGHAEPGFLETVFGGSEEAKNRKNLELATVFHNVVTGGDRVKAAQWYNTLADALGWEKDDPRRLPTLGEPSPNNGQLQHQIDTNVFKNQPKDYQDLVMESLRRNAVGDMSDREIQASKKLRDEQDRNYEIGSSNDLLHHYIEDYMTRVYKDTNPEGQVILSNAKGVRFATNVTMAKQRVYDSNLTALLKSPKQMLLDPVQITAQGRASLIKAAANRQLIDSLRDKFTRASDGRPAVVLSGSGQVISGQNGEDPSIFVDPNRVRKINIDPKVIEQLSASGDLQRYLENGTIRDITPYVRPNNIGAAIDRLEEQAQRRTPVPDEHGQNPLRTQIMLLKSMQANGDFRGLKDFNDALTKKYAWDPQDYVSLANNAMKGWNFITNSPDGTPVYVRSDIKVHPEFAEYLQNRLGLAPSEIAKHPIGKALLGAGSKLKQTLLSLSPFHLVQEALRGIMVGVNPFHITGPDILSGEKINPEDPNSPTIIRKAVENGFTTGTDYKSLQEHSEGLSSGGGILNKIPGVGTVIGNSLNWYQDFLFKRYIPALKARSVELMYHEYQRLHPDWSVDRIAKAAALHANDTFGGINWRAMGRSATTQDWGRLMMLAPDWLESEMRSGARLFNKEEGGLGRAQVAKMALGLWGIARVLNLVTTGNAHYEAPFGLATKNKEGKETIFSIRTLPTDLLHAASDPVGFIKGRLSPTVRMGQELVSGRDQFGRKLQPQDLWVDVFRNMAPIPLQAVGQALSGQGPEIGNFGQAVKAVGGTAMVYRTPAQKMAADLAADHTESGPVDPAQMARHHRILQLEDQARAGEISWPDLYKLTYATDQLKPDELKKIETNVKETKGMDPSMAALYSRASRLPAKDYLDLLDVMNNSEKAALAPLTLKVQKRYLNKAKKDETPAERAKDPVFQRFLQMIPGQHSGPISQVTSPIPAAIQQEASYLYNAINNDTGHQIGSNDGQNWFDRKTGEAING